VITLQAKQIASEQELLEDPDFEIMFGGTGDLVVGPPRVNTLSHRFMDGISSDISP
jgi:hypothetical protein